MRSFNNGLRIVSGVSALAGVLLVVCISALPGALAATKKPPKPGPPIVVTGAVAHVRGTAGQLEGAINPRSAATTYYFKYGPTIAYGSQTPMAALPAGTATVKVGQAVSLIRPGYHYRLLAMNEHGLKEGADHVYSPKTTTKLKFSIAKGHDETQVTYGRPVVISGALTGIGNALRQLVLQASPYPYREAFATVGAPVLTSATGSFEFHVSALTKSTQFRFSTLDPRPLFSTLVTEHVTARVTLKVRSTKQPGLVRLYGTVAPAEAGAPVLIQLSTHVRPKGKSAKTTRFLTRFHSTVKRGTKTISRFSLVARVAQAGHYRALVELPNKGAIASGASSTVTLKAAPRPAHKGKKKA